MSEQGCLRPTGHRHRFHPAGLEPGPPVVTGQASRAKGYPWALALLAAGGVALLVSSSMPWQVAAATPAASSLGMPAQTWTGGELFALMRAAGPVSLAAIAGLLATGATGRRIVGTLLVATGLAGSWSSAAGVSGASMAVGTPGQSPVETTGWPWLGLAGGLLVLAVGGWTLWAGAAWPSMGTRYQRRNAAGVPTSPWDALDQGSDPTKD